MRKMDIDAKKLLIMHGDFSVNIGFISQERRVVAVKFTIEYEQRNLSFYVHHSECNWQLI